MSAYFPPEMGAPANRVYELTRRWAKKGHSVCVLTGFPNHPTGRIPPAYRSKFFRGLLRERVEGVDLFRVWLYASPNRKAWERILNYSSFSLSASFFGAWLPRPDVVVATSPHLLAGLTGWWIARLFRVPFVLEVRDLWPESLVASGAAAPGSPLIRTLERLAAFLYSQARMLVPVTQAIAEKLQSRWGVSPARIHLLEHAVDPERFQPMPPTPWPAYCEGLDGQVVSYVGTLGLAHGLSTFLQAAGWVGKKEPALQFLLVGEGAEKEKLMEEARLLGLRNTRFLSQQPWQELPALINRCTICVASLKPGEPLTTAMPTKILEYFACGKPVVLAGLGHARRVVERSGGGLAVDPGDPRALGEAILTLARDPALRRRLGEAGRRCVLERFQIQERAAEYAALLEGLVS